MSPFTSHPDELISASLTGDLSPLERRELERHLAACPECRATLDAFREERHLLGAMAQPSVPRDMGARVRAGIESGRFGAPWWRRPGGLLAVAGSVGTVAAAGLLAVFFLNLGRGQPPVASSVSASPSAVASLSTTPPTSPSPTPSPPASLLSLGDTGYLSLQGTLGQLKMSLRRDDKDLLSLQTPAGPPLSAALSPDLQWLAYETEVGLKGTNALWVVKLGDGTTIKLGETSPSRFARFEWAPNADLLAYTRLDDPSNPASGTDAWLLDVKSGKAYQATSGGDGYAASFAVSSTGKAELWISVASPSPTSYLLDVASVQDGTPAKLPADALQTADGIFLPIVNGDGSRVIFWRGQMGLANDSNRWEFMQGGMPYLAEAINGVPIETAPGNAQDGPPGAKQLFADLEPGQNAFHDASIAWSEDADAFAVWNARWTGVVRQSGRGEYPSENAVYVGRVSTGQFISDSSFSYVPKTGTVRAVSLTEDKPGDAGSLLVTVQTTSGGESADSPGPHAELHHVAVDRPDDSLIGPKDVWNGPAVHVYAGFVN
jgi:hypothetical protein